MLCTSSSLFKVKKSFILWRVFEGSAGKEYDVLRQCTYLQENDFLIVLDVLNSQAEPDNYVLHVLSTYGIGYVYSYRFKDIEKMIDACA